jgi:hypothetical protein
MRVCDLLSFWISSHFQGATLSLRFPPRLFSTLKLLKIFTFGIEPPL